MLKKSYIDLRNVLYESHSSFEANILLTRNYKTSRAAHQRLEQIMKRECERALKIDYGLQILPDTVLKIANTEEFQWLLQPELKAIKDGLTYVDDKDCSNDLYMVKYRGYLDAIGRRKGVGISEDDNCKYIGEWLDDKPHGILLIEEQENNIFSNGESFRGQFKHGRREGYSVDKNSNTPVSYLQWKNDQINDYGIRIGFDGVYCGELFQGMKHGYGLIKYPNKDEYDGQWDMEVRIGEGVFKKASTGRVERSLYENNQVKEVLEVIEEGHRTS